MASQDDADVHDGGMRPPSWTLGLACLALLLWLGAGAAPEALVYDRAAIAGGEWWRLLTGHWVHSDAVHALWDIAALVLLGFLFEPLLKRHFLPLLLWGSAGVNAWLWWDAAAPRYYCGLSGILNTLLVAGLLVAWRKRPHVLIPLTGLGLLLKNLLELNGDRMLLTHTAWPGVPEAHLAGMLAGIFYTWFFLAKPEVRRHENQAADDPAVADRCPRIR